VNVDVTDQILILYSVFSNNGAEIGEQWGSTSTLYGFKEAHKSVMREVFIVRGSQRIY
jgi:hypothetical protein